jgi:hypothetical protein
VQQIPLLNPSNSLPDSRTLRQRCAGFAGERGVGSSAARIDEQFLTPIDIQYDGTAGELYNVHEDPHQWRNLWADPDYASIRDDLVRDRYDSLPKTFNRLEVAAPV